MAHDVLIIPAIPAHVAMLTPRLRDGDRAEVQAAGMAGKAVWRSFRQSAFCKTAFVDGEIAAMWGLGSPMAPVAHPWLLTAPPIEKIKLTFLRVGRNEVAAMLRASPVLAGIVDDSYERAIRYLRALGFEVGRPFSWGPYGMPFREYRLERSWVS